jgi:transposase
VGEWLRSPYDRDVRSGRKRTREWIGYKVHLTEGGEDDLPHLITQVTTAPAIEQDHQALDAIQADLADHDLLPAHQLLDAGYVSAKRILSSRDRHAVDLIGPAHSDPSWQARTPGAVDVSQFSIDWRGEQVTCPQGQHSISWYRGTDAKVGAQTRRASPSSRSSSPSRRARHVPSAMTAPMPAPVDAA